MRSQVLYRAAQVSLILQQWSAAWHPRTVATCTNCQLSFQMPAAQHPALSESPTYHASGTATHRLTELAPGLCWLLCAGECIAALQQRVSSPGRSLPV